MKFKFRAIKYIIILGLILWADKSFALTISPPVRELSGDPGSTVQGIVKLYNETNQEVTVYGSATSFTAKENGSGEPEFVSFESEENARNLASWMKVPAGPIIVKPLDWQNTIIEVNIPKDAEPGGHYAAVFFSPNPVSVEKGTVSVDYRTGSLFLLSVSGDIKESANLKDFITKNNQTFFEHIPVMMELRIGNDGNIHFKPGGEVEIKNIFSQKVAELPIVKTATGGNVLPGSTRRYDISWGEIGEKNLPESFWNHVKFEWKNFRIGKYTASAVIKLPGSQEEKRVIGFWIIPWQLLSVMALGLVALWFLFRQYNRWIIKKARAGK